MPIRSVKRSGLYQIALLGVLATLASTAVAQDGHGPQAAAVVPPGWAGLWAGGGLRGGGEPPGYKTEYPYAKLDALITSHLQPWAMAEQEATEWDIDDTGQVCGLDGIFRQGTGTGAGFNLIVSPGRITLVYGAVDEIGARRIYLNSPHPASLRPSWNGDARGKWDGDTLVVDTVGFNDKSWLNSDREPHTEELHVIERMRLIVDGKYMEIRVIIDDRKALTSPYTYTRYYKKMPADAELRVSEPCDQDPSKGPWKKRREGLLAEHEAALNDYISHIVPQK